MIHGVNSCYITSAEEPRSPLGVAGSQAVGGLIPRNKAPTKRVVSLDSARYRRRPDGALPASARTQSASDAQSRFLSTATPIMVPLPFDKVNEDIAHPLSSMRSCSEFGLNHVKDVLQEDTWKSPSKKRPLWKRAWRWVQGKAEEETTATGGPGTTASPNAEAPLSITEKSELAQLGEQYRQMRMNSLGSGAPRRESRCSVDSVASSSIRTASVGRTASSFASPGGGRRLSSTAVSWSDLPPHGQLPRRRQSSTSPSGPAGRLASDSRRLSQSGGPPGVALHPNQVSAGSLFMREINNSFWGVLGFQTPKPEPMEFEMTTFKMNGVPVPVPHAISLGRLVLNRTFSPRSLTSPSSPRSSLSSVRAARSQSSASSVASSLGDRATSGATMPGQLQLSAQTPAVYPRRRLSDPEVVSVYTKVLSLVRENLMVKSITERVHELPPVLINWTKDMSQYMGEEAFMDAMRMQPAAASIYFRVLLFSGVVSAIFNSYAMFVTWPSLSSLPPGATTMVGGAFLVWFGAILLAHLVQFPLRVGIHLTLLQVPQAEGQQAGDIVRELVLSDVWYLNKFLGWMIDTATIAALLAVEVYLHSSIGSSDVTGGAYMLRSALLNVAGTAVLNLMIRGTIIALFCITAFDPQTLLDARKRGLSKWNVDKLPTFIYSDARDVGTPECSICLCSFERGEMLIRLPCDSRHSFHGDCIRDWLLRQNACPLCQKVI